jgi:hypothetical protein
MYWHTRNFIDAGIDAQNKYCDPIYDMNFLELTLKPITIDLVVLHRYISRMVDLQTRNLHAAKKTNTKEVITQASGSAHAS